MTAAHHPIDFICPGCGAGYKVVRIKAEADPAHRLIHCRVCKRSLAPTDREYILKYFLRFAPQVLAVQFEEVEGIEENMPA